MEGRYIMFCKFKWDYDGQTHESGIMFIPTLSELHEHAKYIYNTQDNCPLWVIILNDDNSPFAILPL